MFNTTFANSLLKLLLAAQPIANVADNAASSPLGNLYDGTYRAALGPRPCPLNVCDCHIGYVHLETLPLYDVFAGGVLERVPVPAARTPLPVGARTSLPVTSVEHVPQVAVRVGEVAAPVVDEFEAVPGGAAQPVLADLDDVGARQGGQQR